MDLLDKIKQLVESTPCESRPSNREYLIRQLADPDWIDDGWASFEATVHYNIKCPYFSGDKRAHCYGNPDEFINRENCYFCKLAWLDTEVDE